MHAQMLNLCTPPPSPAPRRQHQRLQPAPAALLVSCSVVRRPGLAAAAHLARLHRGVNHLQGGAGREPRDAARPERGLRRCRARCWHWQRRAGPLLAPHGPNSAPTPATHRTCRPPPAAGASPSMAALACLFSQCCSHCLCAARSAALACGLSASSCRGGAAIQQAPVSCRATSRAAHARRRRLRRRPCWRRPPKCSANASRARSPWALRTSCSNWASARRSAWSDSLWAGLPRGSRQRCVSAGRRGAAGWSAAGWRGCRGCQRAGCTCRLRRGCSPLQPLLTRLQRNVADLAACLGAFGWAACRQKEGGCTRQAKAARPLCGSTPARQAACMGCIRHGAERSMRAAHSCSGAGRHQGGS